MMALGGSFGLQIGGQATDFVLLLNDRAAKGILAGNVKLGGDASVAGCAEILSYSRARGAFAGISLEGSTLRPDNDANKKLYGRDLHAEDIVLKHAVNAERTPTAGVVEQEVAEAQGVRSGTK